MLQTIRFIAPKRYWTADGLCRLAQPYAAKAKLPDWFKALPRYSPSESGGFPHRTAKMCPPFLEAMTHGYIIPAPFDFSVDLKYENDQPVGFSQRLADDIDAADYDDWAPIVGREPPEKFAGSPWQKALAMKLRGFWRIETPPGYSCLLIEPLNRNFDELPFYVAPQVVDTDRSSGPISFSLVARQPFPIVVEENTPLVQVIPFLRCQWDLQTVCLGSIAVQEITEFRDAYWSCENRQFDEGADTTNPEHGYGAFAKLVKKHTRFE